MSVADASALPDSVYRQPGFVPFLISRVLAMFAVQILAVVVAWQVYDMTRDPLSLAYVGLAQFVPMFLLLMPAGDLIDRYDRKRILALSWALEAICAAALLWLSLSGGRCSASISCWCSTAAPVLSPDRRCPACCRRSCRASAWLQPSPPTA